MNTLEIENTQGITLKYNTANTIERFGAFLIDIILLGIVTWILTIAIGVSGYYSMATEVIIALPFIFYTLFMEIFNNGQSVGKLSLGLKVVRVDGKEATGYDYLIRWIFRFIDIYGTSGALAALTVSATPRSQRVGDMLADTTVIRTRNIRIPLKRILSLKKLDSYTPKYPQAKFLKEEQVLLIKETLQRAARYKNDSHLAALKELRQRVAQILEVEKPGDSRIFLNTVIKDYIALTR